MYACNLHMSFPLFGSLYEEITLKYFPVFSHVLVMTFSSGRYTIVSGLNLCVTVNGVGLGLVV